MLKVQTKQLVNLSKLTSSTKFLHVYMAAIETIDRKYNFFLYSIWRRAFHLWHLILLIFVLFADVAVTVTVIISRNTS